MGEDIGVSEVNRFIPLLSGAIKEVLATVPTPPVDSPVYSFIRGLKAPFVLRASVAEFRTAHLTPAAETYGALMQQAETAKTAGDFVKARSLLTAIRLLVKAENDARPESERRPEDPSLLQRLALATYKSKQPTEESALIEARQILLTLEPETSNDTETLGLWGAIHKRLWNLTKQTQHLDQAVRAYERGFYLRNDYYNGINLAFLLNLRAANSQEPAEAIADFILARRVRRETIDIGRKLLATQQLPAERYWIMATLGEALLGLGDPAAQGALEEAYAAAPEAWMKTSTQEQIQQLNTLLSNSPLNRIH